MDKQDLKQFTRTQVVSAVRSQRPDIWGALCPRVYKGGGECCDPAIPASTLAMQCILDPDTLSSQAQTACCEAIQDIAAALAATKVPTYHVAKTLAASAVATASPEEIDWLDTNLPVEAGLFLLPSGVVHKHDGSPILWTAWARVRPEQLFRIPGKWDTAYRVSYPCFLLAGGCYDSWHSPVSLLCPNGVIAGVAHYWDAQGTRPVDVSHELDWVSLTCNLILIMNARPELVERTGQKVRTIKNGPAREEWTPNWIGRTYRVQRADGDGTHASPRLHWRRGHYRRQPCGAGRKEHKIIWLEPCLVGGETDG